MNAIMTPSAFTTNTIQGYTCAPVLTVTHPVAPETPAPDIRTRLNIPEDAFMVANIFSFGSAMERKNPMGLIAAFKLAFSKNDNAYLVLKANSGENTDEKKMLKEAVADFPHIILLDSRWSKADILGLIASANIYASLHRSEGFGLTIAEAMLLNTPALVTAWSGNMDFCTEENSFLVDYQTIKVDSRHPEFQEFTDATWADANIQTAAEFLIAAYKDKGELLSKQQLCKAQMQQVIETHKYQHALNYLCRNPS